MTTDIKNCAFVFIKPHAVTDKVKALVEKELGAKNIKITSQGSISAEDIDKGQLIDKHYYAIASKATLLQPKDLPVPADRFETHFGISWSDALSKGLVLNATQYSEKTGLNATDLEKKWRECKSNCIKFGGGFYCSNLGTKEEPCYVFNGFFMSLRDKFVAKGKSIQYYTVEFSSSDLSWEDFRGKVLGPTNPADAPKDSVRGLIYAQWKDLGLQAEPDTGDNGVHASASPFEGLAERLNWLKADLSKDSYGQALMNAGVSAQTINEWSVDPQAVVDKMGQKGSLFDALEDMNADVCLNKAVELNNLKLKFKNSAFVFIKPHAVTDKVKSLVKSELKKRNINILTEGSISADEINKGKLIDQHYYAIASKATLLEPKELPVPAEKFKGKFNIAWEDALAKGLVFNAIQYSEKTKLSASDLEKKWGQCKSNCIKFGGGFYCSNLGSEEEPAYVFNGFFMSLRDKFVAKGKSIAYYVVDFDSSTLSWEDFRGKVLGPTNPADAPEDSVRGIIYKRWEELGLEAEPNTGDNGVHASASPFEGLAERLNWLGAKLSDDTYGKALVDAGISADVIKTWSVDPQVTISEGKKGSLFDALEDMNADVCLQRAVELAALNK